ncbi:MAG: hypothetical protein E6G15_12090 [Actinobacteria bacterium]|nr:MAG: hypothetical protein E6G15_12090 [Actinomycetota bacterium]
MLRMAGFVATVLILTGPAAAATAPPPNDNRASASPANPPASVQGTTVGATDEANDPRPSCGRVHSTVWYRINDAPGRRIVLRLHADGVLDGVLAVYEVQRSHLNQVTCDATDQNGRAELSFDSSTGANYLILFGRLPDSVDSTFELRSTAPPRSKPPGTRLPVKGVEGTLDPLDHPDKAWSTVMRAGTTYKINLFGRLNRCVDYSVYAPGIRDFASTAPILRRECGGYATYTPGAHLGGRYSIFVQARGTRSATIHYWLQAAVATTDDLGPGRPIANQQTLSGRLDARRIHVVDVYHFDVPRQSDVTLHLRTGSQFELRLLADNGRYLDSSSSYIRHGLSPGQYFVVVRAEPGSRGGYRVSLLIREITQTTALVGGSRSVTLRPGGTASVEIRVTPAAAGRVQLRINRFLLLGGWVFSRLVNVYTGSDGVARFSWTPPAPGRWRLRAFFQGARTASPSSSGYVFANVSS